MLSSLSGRAWAAIGASLVILGLASALYSARASLAEERSARALAEANLSISNASVHRLEGEMASIMAEQQALAAGDAQRISVSREVLAVVDAASKARQAMTERLLASAAQTSAPSVQTADCTVSAAVEEAWP